jgi:hypothetical protein
MKRFFYTHPEPDMYEGVFTALELRKLIDYIQKQGIEMIPEIESFGQAIHINSYL